MPRHRHHTPDSESSPLLGARAERSPPPYHDGSDPDNPIWVRVVNGEQPEAWKYPPMLTKKQVSALLRCLVLSLLAVGIGFAGLGFFRLGKQSAMSSVNAERDELQKAWHTNQTLLQREWHRNQTLLREEWHRNQTLLQEEWHRNQTLLQKERDDFSAEQSKWRLEQAQERDDIKHQRDKIEFARSRLLKERREWDEERRRQEESDRRDRHRRQRAHLAWVELIPESTCLSYGSRHYSARLMGVPDDVDKLKWCRETSIAIHGIEYPGPDYCGMVGSHVYGHWTVTKGEPGCKTYFKLLENESKCIQGVSRRKRYVGKLENFQEKDWPNWDQMCSTTPFLLHGETFARPDRCELWNGWIGAVGIMEVYDPSCKE